MTLRSEGYTFLLLFLFLFTSGNTLVTRSKTSAMLISKHFCWR